MWKTARVIYIDHVITYPKRTGRNYKRYFLVTGLHRLEKAYCMCVLVLMLLHGSAAWLLMYLNKEISRLNVMLILTVVCLKLFFRFVTCWNVYPIFRILCPITLRLNVRSLSHIAPSYDPQALLYSCANRTSGLVISDFSMRHQINTTAHSRNECTTPYL